MVNLDIFDNQNLNLEILVEEAMEVGQIKSKIIRFGIDDYHPKSKVSNRDKLEEELGHFLAMVDILVYQGTLSKEAIERGKIKKFDKLSKWYNL